MRGGEAGGGVLLCILDIRRGEELLAGIPLEGFIGLGFMVLGV